MIRRALFLLLVATFAAYAQAPSPAPSPASAPTPPDLRFRVDLIVFLDKSSNETPVTALPLNPQTLIELEDAPALAAAGIERLPESDFALDAELKKLRLSKRYQPLVTLSWVQKNPPAERGPALHLHWGAPLSAGGVALDTVDGSIALLMSRYLHLDVDLAYNAIRADGTLGSVPLRERRRMKRDELHYLDSPRLGVLAKISKLKAK